MEINFYNSTTDNMYPDLIYFTNVVGFLVHVSPIQKTKDNSLWEKEVEVIFVTWDPNCGWKYVSVCTSGICFPGTLCYVFLSFECRVNIKVMCILRGTWVEPVAKMLGDIVNIENPPFVHVRYVSEESEESGTNMGDLTIVQSLDENICECIIYFNFLEFVGCAVVSSFSDATNVTFNSSIQAVEELSKSKYV